MSVNPILFVDMDGCIARWNEKASLEEVYSPGYFLNLVPQRNLIEALRKLSESIEIQILSAAAIDRVVEEKNVWLDRHFFGCKRNFVKDATGKGQYVNELGLIPDNFVGILLDDYTRSLMEWETSEGNNKYGIKFFNHVNGTNGNWKRRSERQVSYLSSAEDLCDSIYNQTMSIMTFLPPHARDFSHELDGFS